MTAEAIEPGQSYGSSGNYLLAILDSLEDELIVVDREYRVIEANKAVLLRHGKRRDDIMGKYCHDISRSDAKACQPSHHECPIKRVWETGEPVRVTQLHVSQVKGKKRERYIEVMASPIANEEGDITAVAELTRDVSEIKELESKIAKAQRDLQALNAITSVVTQSLDIDAILGSALDKTLEIMKMGIGGILLLDEEGQILRYRVYQGLSQEYVARMSLPLGEGIAGKVAQTGEAIVVEDISKDLRAAHPDLIVVEKLRAFASVPLRSKEKILGVLNIASRQANRLSAEDIRLLESIAAQIAIAIENAKLHREVQRKDEIRGELLREIFSIQEEERRRIARELHDETSQVVTSLTANLEAGLAMLSPGADHVRARLEEAKALSLNILDEIHRLIYELRPSLLDDLGLVPAVRWLADVNLGATGIKVNFKITGKEKRLPPQVETTLFRIIQETVNNIAKHAHARNTTLNLNFTRNAIRVRIRDDGKGFDVEEAISSKERPRGLGLIGMKERVELVDGNLSIHSRPGGGTEIDVEIPVKTEKSDG